jgi:tetratricopeptide (TPR) repeat protein
LLEHTRNYAVEALPVAQLATRFGTALAAQTSWEEREDVEMLATRLQGAIAKTGQQEAVLRWLKGNEPLRYKARQERDHAREASFWRIKLLYERALTIFEKLFGPEHPEVARSLDRLGELYLHRRRYAEAQSVLKRAVAIWRKVAGSEEYRSDLSHNKYLREEAKASRKLKPNGGK